MSKFTMMVGMPASGKSYYAEELKDENTVIISTDKMREILCGDVAMQEYNDLIFSTALKWIKQHLQNGRDVIFDATNINRKARKNILRSIDAVKKAVFMATPYEIVVENNKNRERILPIDVIRNMYLKFEPPMPQEGFDEIEVKYWKNSKNCYSIKDFIDNACGINQDNPHHSLSIGEHCIQALKKVNANADLELRYAALLHDEGKIFTKAFDGEVAHYYNHHNVSAYNSFFYKMPPSVRHLYVANLISWHMRPFMVWQNNIKMEEKDKIFLGKYFYNDLIKLHNADRDAH